MPPRVNPTARQVRLGAELRRLREAAGLVSRDVAAWLGTSQAQISNIESGKHGVSEERLRRLAEHYACDDPRLVDALGCMANEREKGWWEAYRSILPTKALDLAELERRASYVRTFQVVHIPGSSRPKNTYARPWRSWSQGLRKTSERLASSSGCGASRYSVPERRTT